MSIGRKEYEQLAASWIARAYEPPISQKLSFPGFGVDLILDYHNQIEIINLNKQVDAIALAVNDGIVKIAN